MGTNNGGNRIGEYRVAVTSGDGVHVDQHFGRANDFLVLQVNGESGEATVECRRPAPDLCTGEGWQPDAAAPGVTFAAQCLGADLDRLERTCELLSDCRYLLTAAIGRKPQSVLLRHGVSALETDGTIDSVIPVLNRYVTRGPAVGTAPSCRLHT